jgi:hypothetical protein
MPPRKSTVLLVLSEAKMMRKRTGKMKVNPALAGLRQ